MGALASWVLATLSTVAFASLASRKKRQLSKSSLNRARILASITLIFIAVDIVDPFPFLCVSLASALQIQSGSPLVQAMFESTKISSILLIVLAVLGILFVVSGREPKKRKALTQQEDIGEGIDAEVAKTGLKSMTLLPIAVQLWVLIATEKLESLSEILATGLFILSGPATWQFASQIMLFAKRSWDGYVHILKVMFLSLLGTLGAMLIGVLLDMQRNPIDPTILSFLASFSLIIIPYFFFYSFWGDKWNQDRPIITICALILAGTLSAVNIGGDSLTQLVVSCTLWFALLIIPFCVRSNESFSKDYYCPYCASEGKTGEIRSFKGRLRCQIHRNATLEIQEEVVEERKSLFRFFKELVRTRSWLRPAAEDIVLKLEPDKQLYKPGDHVAVTVEVKNDRETTRNHPVICNMKVGWKVAEEKWPIDEDHSWIDPEEPKRARWPLEGPIPSPLLKPELETVQDLDLILEVRFSHYKPKGYRKRSVPFPRKTVLSISKQIEVT